MAPKLPSIVGKILYGSVFIIVLPVLLVGWAIVTDEQIPLPAPQSRSLGGLIALAGAAIMISGMHAIIVYGKGMPMNAYPPERFVFKSIYRVLPHPIYTGFSLLCFGLAIALGSASGLWLISPCVALGCVALVQGYEKRAIIEHFGSIDSRPFIHLPAPDNAPPSAADRMSCYLFVILTWLIFIGGARVIDASTAALSASVGMDVFPVYAWAEPGHIGRFLIILLLPLLVRQSSDLRNLTVSGLAVTGIACLLFIAFPYGFPAIPAVPGGALNDLLAIDRGLSGRAVFSLASQTAMLLLATYFYARIWHRARVPVYAVSAVVCLSGLLTGTQSPHSFLAGFAIFLFSVRIRGVWESLRATTELIANSWKEWRFGPVRIINHGVYAAVGAFVSLSIAGNLVGPANLGYMMLTAFLAILSAALSAQWIEGGTVSLRPYGWYGGVFGTFAGGAICYAAGGDVWLLAGGFCMAAPSVQAMGRLRCLVQGCCHGYETGPVTGITYRHPVSRVCRLSHLGGVPVHPTPLYSILCNAIAAVILTRLWLSQASLALIVGLYFILTGFGRFIEESYRGEDQTPTLGSLRLYQIFAMLSVVGGICVTMLGGRSGTAPDLRLNVEAVVLSALFGLFAFIAFGLDFPGSSRRFARLT